MSVTVDPLPARGDPPEPQDERVFSDPPDYPARSAPPGLARRARRAAARLRVLRTAAAAAVTAGLVAGVLVASSPPSSSPHRGPAPAPVPPVYAVRNDAPRTSVGLGANAWVQFEGWCIGDTAAEGDVGLVESCRFLPAVGGLDVAVLAPGRFAPEGYSLVVAIAVGQAMPGTTYRGKLTDGTGTDDMAVERTVGMPGVVFLWGFTSGDPVNVSVSFPDGTIFAECTDCAGQPSR
jgi:hypothetical protein